MKKNLTVTVPVYNTPLDILKRSLISDRNPEIIRPVYQLPIIRYIDKEDTLRDLVLGIIREKRDHELPVLEHISLARQSHIEICAEVGYRHCKQRKQGRRKYLSLLNCHN